MSESDILNEIQTIIDNNNVTLFMKGTADFPQCGFSSKVVAILKHLEVEFHDVNVLANNDIRQGIKDFSNWPTIPQLYVSAKFIGGCDIVSEMMEDGELQKLFNQNK